MLRPPDVADGLRMVGGVGGEGGRNGNSNSEWGVGQEIETYGPHGLRKSGRCSDLFIDVY